MTYAYGADDLLARTATVELYRARRRRGAQGPDETVALKKLLPAFARAADFRARFDAEARLYGLFDHPSIVRLRDRGEVDGAPFMALEYVDGLDLRTALRRARERGTTPSPAAGLRVAACVASALAHAFERTDERGRPLRVVHADVCPANILVSFDGDVTLVDFGIAHAAGEVPAPDAPQGRPPYVSPEQLRREAADARSDVFSTGVVLSELLGEQRVSAALRDAVAAATDPSPSARPESAAFERALRACPEADDARGKRDLAAFARSAR